MNNVHPYADHQHAVLLRSIVLLTLVLLLHVNAAILTAQQESSSGLRISGRVVSREGAPLGAATIRLEATNRGTIADRDGRFKIDGLTAGNHAIVVKYVGYKPYRVEVTAGSAEAVGIEIVLDERPSGSVVIRAPRSSYRVTTSSTASKTSTPLLETPASVQTVTDLQLSEQQADRVSEAFDYMTGITQGGGTRAQAYLLRGFAVDDRFIPYQVDGISGGVWRQHEPPAAIIDRIEYLKGPASTLYGVTQLGGVINYITKKPRAVNEASIELRHSTYATDISPFGAKNSASVAADMTGPLTDDGTLLYRVIANQINATSYRNDVEESSLDMFPSLTWNISEATQATVSLNISVDKGRWDEYLPVPGRDISKVPDIRTRINEPTDYYFDYGWGVGYLFRHTLDDNWTLRSVARHTSRIDGRRLFEFSSLKADGTTMARVWRDQFNERYYTYLDATLEGRIATGSVSHTLLTGATVGIEDIHFDRRNLQGDSTLNIDIYNPVHTARVLLPEKPGFDRYWDNVLIGVYLQDQVEVVKEVQLVLGAQYTTSTTTHEERRGELTFDKDNTGISPRIGLVLLPVPFLSIYGSYSTSFSPTNAERENAEGNIDFEPEVGKQIEAGVKADLFDGRLGLTASVYQLDYTNALNQTGGRNANGNAIWVQTGLSRSKGIELELALAPFDGLYLSAGYAYTDARVVEDSNSARIDNRLPFVPFSSGNARIVFRFQEGILPGLKLGIGVTAMGERPTEFPTATGALFVLPDYARVDALMSYEFDRAAIGVNVNNLFDKRYFSNGGTARIVPGNPRTVRTSVQVRF